MQHFLPLVVGAVVPPTIILNVVDDLGWNDVPWSPGTDIVAPKILAMQQSGVTLDQYYVFRFCSPSRSTFQTGRYPFRLGQQTGMNLNPMPGIACGINTNYEFLPKMLATKTSTSYTSYALGKWHLGFLNDSYTPTWRGYDAYAGYYSGAEEHFTHKKAGLGHNFFDLANSTGANGPVLPCRAHAGAPIGDSLYSSYLYGNESVRLIRKHARESRVVAANANAASPAKPLFMFIAWNNVHAPCEAPQQYIDQFNVSIKTKGRRNFAAMMAALDDSMDAVVGALKAEGMWSNTVWIFTTDNGGNLHGDGNNAPLRGGKFTFWQGGVRGRAFVAGGLIPTARRGKTWSGYVHAADWYVTIGALGGASSIDVVNRTGPIAADGFDIWPALISGGDSPRREVVINIQSNKKGNYVDPLSIYQPHHDDPNWSSSSRSSSQEDVRSVEGAATPAAAPLSDAPSARAFPRFAACASPTKPSRMQQWTLSSEGQICLWNYTNAAPLATKPCWNIQRSLDHIIMWENQTQSNAEFQINPKTGRMVSSAMETGACIGGYSNGTQLDVFLPCPAAEAAGAEEHAAFIGSSWTYDATSRQLSATSAVANARSDDATKLCVEAFPNGVPPPSPGPSPSPGPPTKPAIVFAGIIQAQWKFMIGAPGTPDNWVPMPGRSLTGTSTAASGSSTVMKEDERVVSESSDCAAPMGCLFDIVTDPTERHNVANVSANAPIVAQMMMRIYELLEEEVTVEESGLCPTPTGTHGDPSCAAFAAKSGFWEPWLNRNSTLQ